MSIRKLFGLCDHKWRPLSEQIIQISRIRVCDGAKFGTGFVQPRECENCGAVKGFRLS